jgi:hypothetical protein
MVGRLKSGDPKVIVTGSARPTSAGTAQVITIASGSPANSTAYKLRVVDTAGQLDRTITTAATDGSATADELEALIVTAWNTDFFCSGLGNAIVSGGDVVITMRNYRVDVTITEVDTSVLTITETTAPSAASSVPWGRWVQLLAPSGGLGGERFQAISAPTKAASALTITHSGGADYTLQIEASPLVPGLLPVSKLVSFSAGASAALTDDAAEAALAAAFPGTGFVVTNPSAGSVILTAPLGYSLASHSPTASAGDLTVADTAAGALPPLGWVLDTEDVAPLGLGEDVTGEVGGQAITFVRSAPGAVFGVEAPGATPSFGGLVYVETAAGATNGRPYTVQSSTGSRLPISSRWQDTDPVDAAVHYLTIGG